MELREAKDLKIDDEVFVIGSDNEVHPKKVTGVHLRTFSQIDITFINPSEKNINKGYVLSHQTVFLKEKYALGEVLRGYLSQAGDLDLKVMRLKQQIQKLDMEAT